MRGTGGLPRHVPALTGSHVLERASARVKMVREAPEGRLRLREAFYAQHGPGPGAGQGRSELDFIRWQIDRGLLAPLAEGGSPYWRATQEIVSRDAELASLAHRHGAVPLSPGGRAWLRWIERPSAESWYRAHNLSLVHGMRASVDAAREEPELERIFINRALHRVLRAEVLARGGARFGLGWLARRLADPRGPTVRWVTSARWLYPRRYPLRGSLPRRRWSLERAAARWLLDPRELAVVGGAHLHVLCPEAQDVDAAAINADPIYLRELA